MNFPYEYGAIFLIGFLSSMGHCIGMCGGFVVAYTMRIRNQRSRWIPHLLYNIGRVSTYTLLGLFFGFAGQTLQLVAGLQKFQTILQLVAGLAMVVIGLDMGGWLPGARGFSLPGYAFFHKIIGKRLRFLHGGNLFPLGMAMGLIPCGLVYAAGASAAASGGAISGAFMMMAFGLGTVPALLAVGFSANTISVSLRHKLFRAATAMVIILGLFTLYRGGSTLNQSEQQIAAETLHCIPGTSLTEPTDLPANPAEYQR